MPPNGGFPLGEIGGVELVLHRREIAHRQVAPPEAAWVAPPAGISKASLLRELTVPRVIAICTFSVT